MKIEIEVYKGQTIEYDEDYDKFICDISIEDKYKSAKRQSLKDLRKEIDAFIKANASFKPFKAIEISKYDESGFFVVEVKAIRTDGTFVVSKEGSDRNSFYKPTDMQRLRVYDYEVVQAAKRMDKEAEDLRKAHKAEKQELVKTFVPIDLTMYETALTT